MKNYNYYNQHQSIDEWVNTIEAKFSDTPLDTRCEEICKILAINAKDERDKINKASLITYGKKLGVLSFEDACKKLKIETTLLDVSRVLPKYRRQQISFYKLTIIIEAINDGWVINWNDANQYKYYVWYRINDKGFSYDSTDYDNTSTHVPSALYIKTRELAYYMGNMFLPEYKDLLT